MSQEVIYTDNIFEGLHIWNKQCFNISLKLTEEHSIPYREACIAVFRCMKNMGIEITYDKVEEEYLKEKGIKDEK